MVEREKDLKIELSLLKQYELLTKVLIFVTNKEFSQSYIT